MREHLTPERKAEIRKDFKEFIRSFTTSNKDGEPRKKYRQKVKEIS